jgi:hypothetical protein
VSEYEAITASSLRDGDIWSIRGTEGSEQAIYDVCETGEYGKSVVSFRSDALGRIILPSGMRTFRRKTHLSDSEKLAALWRRLDAKTANWRTMFDFVRTVEQYRP